MLLSQVDRLKIESLFIDQKDDVETQFSGLYYSFEQAGGVRRKRILLSSDYRTAANKKMIFDVY